MRNLRTIDTTTPEPLEPRRLLAAAVPADVPNLYHAAAALCQPRRHVAAPAAVIRESHTVQNSPYAAQVLAVGSTVLITNTNGWFTGPDITRVDIYDGATNQWSVTHFPTGYDSSDATGVALDTGVMYFGDFESAFYDVVTHRWSTHPTRFDAAFAGVGHTAVFAGGHSPTRHGDRTSARVDLYDSDTTTWSVAQLSEARVGIDSVTVGTKIFFYGGFNADDKLSNTVDIFDADTGRWSVGHLAAARQNITTEITGNGRYLRFVGGRLQDGTPYHAQDVYDLRTGRWSVTTKANRGPQPLITVGSLRFTRLGRQPNATGDVIDVYDTATRTSTKLTLSTFASSITAVDLGNSVLFAEDVDRQNDPSVFDVYNLRTHRLRSLTTADPLGGLPDTVPAGTGRALALQGRGLLGAPAIANVVTDRSALAPVSADITRVDLPSSPRAKGSARVTLYNPGPAAAPAGTVSIYAIPAAKTAGVTALLLGATTIPTLAPGKSLELKLPLQNLPPGAYRLAASLDTGHGVTVIAESSTPVTPPSPLFERHV